MNKLPSKAVDTGEAMLTKEDMRVREEAILADIRTKTGFVPVEVIWRSDYLGTGRIGATNYRGMFEGKTVVLKVQGVKPAVSESEMIEKFEAQNKSRIIRPPLIYRFLPWDEKNRYEAFLMEVVTGGKVVESGKILTAAEIKLFFDVYKEYKRQCINDPWLPRPETDPLDDLAKRVSEIMKEVKPNSPLRKPGDLDLALTAMPVLKKIWQGELEFVHGHFSAEDLMRQNDEIVLFSNLFWKWKNPFYDLAFGYHWEIYTLARVIGITGRMIEAQRELWLAQIRQTAEEIRPGRGRILADAARLERAIAGLLVDGHAYLDETSEIARYLIEATRKQVTDLTQACREAI